MTQPSDGSDRLAKTISGWSGPVHWTEDRPGDWTAAWEGKEALVRALTETSYEARVRRQATGPDGPDPDPTNGPVVFPTPDEALAWSEDELGAPLPRE
jgi:hypothetical protein